MRLATLAVAAALAACAIPRVASARPVEALARRGPWSVELVDEGGHVLPTFTHRGQTCVLGANGGRYLVRVRNGSPRRVEVVVSVDGRDVIDGEPAGWEKRGYLVDPHGTLVVDGYRLSQDAVAAFRFGTVARSYAARMGDARDVGVIGVAVFPERERRPPPVASYPPHPRPWEDGRDAAAPEARAEERPGVSPAPSAPSDAIAGVPHAGSGEARRRDAERPGLGTEFGEEHASPVVEVAFERARTRPDAVLTLRYDDRAGLVALGIDVDRRWLSRREEARLRETADPFRRSGSYAEPPPGWTP